MCVCVSAAHIDRHTNLAARSSASVPHLISLSVRRGIFIECLRQMTYIIWLAFDQHKNLRQSDLMDFLCFLCAQKASISTGGPNNCFDVRSFGVYGHLAMLWFSSRIYVITVSGNTAIVLMLFDTQPLNKKSSPREIVHQIQKEERKMLAFNLEKWELRLPRVPLTTTVMLAADLFVG